MEGINMSQIGPKASNVPTQPKAVGPSPIDDRERQIHREIKKRRYQRWIFYAIISVIFIIMVAYIVKIYSDNTKLIDDIIDTKQSLETVNQDLGNAQQQLIDRQRQIAELEREIAANQEVLSQKVEELRQASEGQTELINKYQEFRVQLGTADANIYSFLLNFSTGVSSDDIAKIPLAEYNFGGEDTDGDGLSDIIEESFGTSKDNRDSDGDGYTDKEELLNGYDPMGVSSLPLDPAFVDDTSGLILIQAEQNGEAWYISPKDGKRYFLGRPVEVLAAIERL